MRVRAGMMCQVNTTRVAKEGNLVEIQTTIRPSIQPTSVPKSKGASCQPWHLGFGKCRHCVLDHLSSKVWDTQKNTATVNMSQLVFSSDSTSLGGHMHFIQIPEAQRVVPFGKPWAHLKATLGSLPHTSWLKTPQWNYCGFLSHHESSFKAEHLDQKGRKEQLSRLSWLNVGFLESWTHLWQVNLCQPWTLQIISSSYLHAFNVHFFPQAHCTFRCAVFRIFFITKKDCCRFGEFDMWRITRGAAIPFFSTWTCLAETSPGSGTCSGPLPTSRDLQGSSQQSHQRCFPYASYTAPFLIFLIWSYVTCVATIHPSHFFRIFLRKMCTAASKHLSS